jgi:hypothetical protein
MGKITLANEASVPANPSSGDTLVYSDAGGLWVLRPDGVSLFLGPFDVQEITADYTALETDGLVIIDASGAPVTLTLPPGRFGHPFRIKVVDATNTVTVDGDGAETIDGSASFTLAVGESSELWWDGTEWREAL